MATLGVEMAQAAWGAAKGVFRGTRAAYGNPLARTALLGAAGGIYGAMSSDFENENLVTQDAMKGAIGGLALGAIAGPLGFKMMGKGLWGGLKRTPTAARMGWGAGKAILGGARRFAAPLAVAGAGLYGVSGLMGARRESAALGGGRTAQYTQSQLGANPQDFGFVSPMGTMGAAPNMMRNYFGAMQQSTTGLVQAMHSNRHR